MAADYDKWPYDGQLRDLIIQSSYKSIQFAK